MVDSSQFYRKHVQNQTLCGRPSASTGWVREDKWGRGERELCDYRILTRMFFIMKIIRVILKDVMVLLMTAEAVNCCTNNNNNNFEQPVSAYLQSSTSALSLLLSVGLASYLVNAAPQQVQCAVVLWWVFWLKQNIHFLLLRICVWFTLQWKLRYGFICGVDGSGSAQQRSSPVHHISWEPLSRSGSSVMGESKWGQT